MAKINVISLFSGCGGMDIGFAGGFICLKKSVNTNIHPDWIDCLYNKWVKLKKTDFEIVFANDIRKDAKNAWVSYFKNTLKNAEDIYHLDSIVDLVKQEQSGINIFPKNADIITGGFPCQDFSVAGKRKGFNSSISHNGILIEDEKATVENRGQLYIWMKNVINIVRPKLFIAENVKGLVNLENVKSIIEKDFSSAANGGYLVIPAQILHSADYGVPQSRERVFFFGFKKSALSKQALNALSSTPIPKEYTPYPKPTHAYTVDKTKNLYPPVTCKDIFFGLQEPDKSSDLSQQAYSRAKYMGKHCQGQIEINLNSIAPTIRAEHHGNIEFRRLSKLHNGKNIKELNKNLKERRLSVRECARIQTFPDEYQFIIKNKVTSSNAYQLIGNAVPCLLAYNIAMRISENWQKWFGSDI